MFSTLLRTTLALSLIGMLSGCGAATDSSSANDVAAPSSDVAGTHAKAEVLVSQAKDDFIQRYLSTPGLVGAGVGGLADDAWITVFVNDDASLSSFVEHMLASPSRFKKQGNEWLYAYTTPGFPGAITYDVRMKLEVTGPVVIGQAQTYAKSLELVTPAKDDFINLYKSTRGINGVAAGGTSNSDAWISVMFIDAASLADFVNLMSATPSRFKKQDNEWLYEYTTPGHPGQISYDVRIKLEVVGPIVIQQSK